MHTPTSFPGPGPALGSEHGGAAAGAQNDCTEMQEALNAFKFRLGADRAQPENVTR